MNYIMIDKISSAKKYEAYGCDELNIDNIEIFAQLDRYSNKNIEEFLCKKCNIQSNNYYGFKITFESDSAIVLYFEEYEILIGIPKYLIKRPFVEESYLRNIPKNFMSNIDVFQHFRNMLTPIFDLVSDKKFLGYVQNSSNPYIIDLYFGDGVKNFDGFYLAHDAVDEKTEYKKAINELMKEVEKRDKVISAQINWLDALLKGKSVADHIISEMDKSEQDYNNYADRYFELVGNKYMVTDSGKESLKNILYKDIENPIEYFEETYRHEVPLFSALKGEEILNWTVIHCDFKTLLSMTLGDIYDYDVKFDISNKPIGIIAKYK